ncbi:MAG: alpha/beta hydrolase [Planctomycetota bacterium]
MCRVVPLQISVGLGPRVAGPITLIAILIVQATGVDAEQLIQLRNGMVLRGSHIPLVSMSLNQPSGDIQNKPIWMVDDGLRRTYVHRRGMVAAEPTAVPDLDGSLRFKQPIVEGGDQLGSMGTVLSLTPFDPYGRRVLTVLGQDGNSMRIYQGITELTSLYTKVESLKGARRGKRSIQLDMRIATESLSSETLHGLFRRRIDQSDVDARLEALRFFMNTKRYGDAIYSLRSILRDFPEEKQFEKQLVQLVQLQAGELLTEVKARKDAGQLALAREFLSRFPVDQVGQRTRIEVEDALQSIRAFDQQYDAIISQLVSLIDQMDAANRQPLLEFAAEIRSELTPATLSRLSDFIRLGKSDEIPAENRVALAVAGWILGSGSGETNLKIALSLIELRRLVRAYLIEPASARRANLLDAIRAEESASAERVAAMLPLMRPPLAAPVPDDPMAAKDALADPSVAGMYSVGPQLTPTPGAPAGDCGYVIQLPPEYDPLRPYPCVVALHDVGVLPQTQLNWWCGTPKENYLSPFEDQPDLESAEPQEAEAPEGAAADLKQQAAAKTMRLGHAMRHGFIVITPVWTLQHQKKYLYTPREHEVVFRCLRSAMRRWSIDADRVFIGGHGAGGTAAWDIAISHPDLWAGVIAVNANPDKTIRHYNANSRSIPIYVVGGDKNNQPLKQFGGIYDDYMTYQNDAMVVLYRGRARDSFYDEIDRIFEWCMAPAHRRAKPPDEIDAVTMRDSDHFFWWLEWKEMLPGISVDPILWTQNARLQAAPVQASISRNNEVRLVQWPSADARVWLSPDLPLDFNERIIVRNRSRRIDILFDGDVETMLEDVRQRADRKRPFWIAVDVP